MRKASTGMLEQGPQAPAPAPDLIPAKNQPRTNTGIGAADGGTSAALSMTTRGHGDVTTNDCCRVQLQATNYQLLFTAALPPARSGQWYSGLRGRGDDGYW